jgi:inner membrane protein
MTGRTHDAFAFASLITAAIIFSPDNLNMLTLAGCVVAADIGGLLPDIDQAGNRLWDLLPAGNTLGKIFRRIFYKHRTISHSIIGVFLVYKFLDFLLPRLINASYANPELILISLMIGYTSHLFADSLTEEGIPLLFPIPLNFGVPPIRSWRIKTGQWFEKFVVFPGVWVYVFWFIYNNQEVLINIFKKL